MNNKSYEYRLSFEAIDPFTADALEQRHGKDFSWIDAKEWERLPWQPPTIVISTNPWQQFNTLKEWAESHYQPIRNVQLEEREAPSPDTGWTTYKGK